MAYKEKRFCAFCKNYRTFYLKKHLSGFDIFLASVASLALMLLIWQDVDIKAFYFFVFAVVVSEALVLLRWRMRMICDICGFDPILYKRNAQQAAEKVKTFMALRQNDPKMLLKPYPKMTPLRQKKPLRRPSPVSAAGVVAGGVGRPAQEAKSAPVIQR